MKLVYLDTYNNEVPFVCSYNEFYKKAHDKEEVVYTANIAVYNYFRLCVKNGVIDKDSCVEYRGKIFHINKNGKVINGCPSFVDEDIAVLGSLF